MAASLNGCPARSETQDLVGRYQGLTAFALFGLLALLSACVGPAPTDAIYRGKAVAAAGTVKLAIKAKGKAKEAVGDLTDNERLEREGKRDQAEGAAEKAKGHVKDAADDVRDGVDDLRK